MVKFSRGRWPWLDHLAALISSAGGERGWGVKGREAHSAALTDTNANSWHLATRAAPAAAARSHTDCDPENHPLGFELLFLNGGDVGGGGVRPEPRPPPPSALEVVSANRR